MDDKKIISDRSREEWLHLIDKYFEAETSEEEELALKLFLASPQSMPDIHHAMFSTPTSDRNFRHSPQVFAYLCNKKEDSHKMGILRY